MGKRKLNLELIGGNLAEAADELKRLVDLASNHELNEGELQVGLLHAYHHLNFAWNVKFVPTSRYARLSKAEFDRWGRYPVEIERL
jgi:hypothetical protein